MSEMSLLKAKGRHTLTFGTTCEGEVIRLLSDSNLCSSGRTLLCRVLLNLLRAVQTVSSGEERPRPTEAGPLYFSNWHFPSCPHSLHQYSQPEWRRPLGRRAKCEWEKTTQSRNTAGPGASLGFSFFSVCCNLLAQVSCFSWIQTLNIKNSHYIKLRD